MPAVLPDWSKLTSRKILRISILDGHLKLSKAWSELLAVRINDSQNQEISTTKFVSGSNNPLWNTEILCVVSQDNDDLYVGLVQMVDGKQSINQFEHIPIRGDLGIANPVQKSIIIKQGYLNILLEILPDSPQQLLSTVNYMCAQTREKITNQFSTQITFDFPSRITPLMSKFKQPKMKLFKDNDQYLSNSDIEEIYYLLSPLFEYLNSNFEVIMSSLDEQASLLVIQNIWNKFLQDCQLILVPNLLDTKERKPWEIKRFLFFKKMVEITTEFFQGEGQGLTLEMINSNQYTQLTNIMNHYYDSKEDLMELYFKKEYQEEGLGYLMLLKLKGHLQFVEQQLKNRSSVDV